MHKFELDFFIIRKTRNKINKFRKKYDDDIIQNPEFKLLR